MAVTKNRSKTSAARLGSVAILLAALLIVSSCGDEESRRVQRDVPAGALTSTDGKAIRDWGPARERKLVVARLAAIQRGFRAGRMAAVCESISSHALTQFTPGRTHSSTPCPAKLRAFASQLHRRGVEPVRLRLLWVRAYPIVASAWVEDPRGKTVRVGFTDVDGTGMKLEVGTFTRRDLLYGYLDGARAYLKRPPSVD